MTEALVTPDVEAAVQSFLRASLTARGWVNFKVASSVPATRPQYMVKVTLTGGSTRGQVSHDAQVTVECWAAKADGTGDSVKASELARLCHGLTGSLPGAFVGPVWFRRVQQVSGPVFFPDPDTSLPRYQFTSRLDVRPSAV
jgi:hypothetical protein